MKAIDGFKFEMKVIVLLYSCFEVYTDDCVKIFKLSEKLEDTFMTDFSDGYLNTTQIEDHLAQ